MVNGALLLKYAMKAFILAAGKGTRMKSRMPKPLLKVGDKPIVFHTIEILQKAGVKNVSVLTGHKAEIVEKEISSKYPSVKFIRQEVKLGGTGDAVRNILAQDKNPGKDIIVMNSDDSLFYDPKEIKEIIKSHTKNKYLASLFLTTENLGRKYRKVMLDQKNRFLRFTKRPSKKGFTVTGFYIFKTDFIEKALKKIKLRKGELGLTDFMYFPNMSKKILPFLIDSENWFGINTKEELKLANKKWKDS